jgi:hypothetical protein
LNKYIPILLFLCFLLVLPAGAVVTTNLAVANISSSHVPCVVFTGTTSIADEVYFNYGHSSNLNYSSSTLNQTKPVGCWTVTRCNEPTFLPGEMYHVRACGISGGCGAAVNFTMPALVPHPLETFSATGQLFIDNGGDPSWVAAHIWDVYSMTWGSYFLLILIAFVFMNVTIKQKSITISFLLMLISGAALFALVKQPELQHIAEILMAVALAGLAFWMYKRRR